MDCTVTPLCAVCKRLAGVIPYYNSALVCRQCGGILAEITSFDPRKTEQPGVFNDSFPRKGVES